MSGVKVTKECDREGCNIRFEVTPADMLNPDSQPRFCGRSCRRTYRNARQDWIRSEINGPCKACGSTGQTLATYGLIICRPCRTVAWRSCWRKVQHLLEGDAIHDFNDGVPLSAYRCELCGLWHGTSNAGDPDEQYEQRRRQVAAYLASVQFDINVARGWSNTDRLARKTATNQEPPTHPEDPECA